MRDYVTVQRRLSLIGPIHIMNHSQIYMLIQVSDSGIIPYSITSQPSNTLCTGLVGTADTYYKVLFSSSHRNNAHTATRDEDLLWPLLFTASQNFAILRRWREFSYIVVTLPFVNNIFYHTIYQVKYQITKYSIMNKSGSSDMVFLKLMEVLLRPRPLSLASHWGSVRWICFLSPEYGNGYFPEYRKRCIDNEHTKMEYIMTKTMKIEI